MPSPVCEIIYAGILHWHVENPGVRIIGGSLHVSSAKGIGTDAILGKTRSFLPWLQHSVWKHCLVTGARINLAENILHIKVNREQILTRHRIHRLEDCGLASRDHCLAHFPIDRQFHYLPLKRPVQIKQIIFNMLKVPRQFTGVSVKSNSRISV